jgi:hypothetical protein
MKVVEIIERLQKMPPSAEVVFQYNNSDLLYGFIDYVETKIKRIDYNEKSQNVELWE